MRSPSYVCKPPANHTSGETVLSGISQHEERSSITNCQKPQRLARRALKPVHAKAAAAQSGGKGKGKEETY